MKSARPSAAGEPTPASWATNIATDVVDRLDAARQQHEATEAHSVKLIAAVQASGSLFFQRLFAELRSAAEAFNERLGQPVVDVSQWPSGQILVNTTVDAGRGIHIITIMPLLEAGMTSPPTAAAGAMVTVRRAGAGTVTPYDFDLDGDRLCLRCGGGLLGPEAFGREIAADWLRTLPLGGR